MTTYRIDDFPKSGKIKVTPEESRIVQERLFKEGLKWRDSEALKVIHTDAPFLFWDDNILLWDERTFVFNDDPNPEYTMSLFEPKQSEGDEVWGIHSELLGNKQFTDGIDTLYRNKPQDKAFSKACEELNELSAKLLQWVNKDGNVSDIEEEIVDVQMHILLLQKYFNKDSLKKLCKYKTNKMVESSDFRKYIL